MDLARTPDSSPTLPAYSADGVAGYFTTGTTETVQWCNQITQELLNAIIWAGLSPDPLSDTQLRDALGGAASVKSHATSISSGHTAHKRALVASWGTANADYSGVFAAGGNSSATGVESGILGSHGAIASGTMSAVVASAGGETSGARSFLAATSTGILSGDFTEATGDDSALIAVAGSTVSGDQSFGAALVKCNVTGHGSALFSSYNTTLDDDWTVGGGYNGLTWKVGNGWLRLNTAVSIGGTCAATNTGETISLNGSTGKITANGGLTVGTATGTLNADPATVNAPSGQVHEFWVGSSVWSTGDIFTQTILCNKAGADSVILPSVQADVSGVYQPIACGIKSQDAGSFTIWAKNEGSNMTDPSIVWRFVVVNPA